jgi:hypothetical protein
MKINRESILKSIVVMLFITILATACTTEPATPIPLPTARVPSLLEVSGAIDRWEAGYNLDYFMIVEETNNEGTFLYRIVIADGEIQVAQRMEKIAGKWQAPVPVSNELAESYTVDALLARVLRDARGEGPAPMNMFTVFDSFTGFPSVVEAKAMPSYTEDGKLKLNRDFSYTFSVTVDVLLEDTFGFNKTPLLTLNLSGGEQAACSTLRIFSDRTSIYSDNCRQTLLQIIPPEESFNEVEALVGDLALLEDVRTEDGMTQKVVLNGTGEGNTNAEQLDSIWALAFDLNSMLSQPIGAGMTLLNWNGEQLLGYDMRTNLAQPASLEFRAPFYGGVTDDAGQRLTYADAAGLKWLDILSGETGTYGANPIDFHYVPLRVTSGGKIMLQRVANTTGATEWGWISLDDRSWHPLPEAINCITGIAGNPVNESIAVTSAVSDECNPEHILWIVDLDSNEFEPIVIDGASVTAASWSSDASTLAFGIATQNEDDTHTGSIYLLDSASIAIDNLFDIEGNIGGLTWRDDGARIYYGLSNGNPEINGLYEYDLAADEVTNALSGNNLAPISFDPQGEFLAFTDGNGVQVWLIEFGRVVPISRGPAVDAPFVGWIDSSVTE